MKRTSLLLIPILLIALLLCSCNADAQDGIFSAIADSAPDAGIKVQAYLGTDSTGTYHYILTDTGVYSINDSDFNPIENTDGMRFIQACISEDYIYVRSTTSSGDKDLEGSKISRYSMKGIKDSAFTEIPNVKKLLVNGTYYTCDDSEEKQSIHFLKASTSNTDFFSETETKTVSTILESENYVFVELSDKSYVIFDSTNGAKVFKSTKGTLESPSAKGFQTLSNSLFLVVQNNNKVYSITSAGLNETETTLSNVSGNIVHSFHYNVQTEGKDFVVFKCSNSFNLYELVLDGTNYKLTSSSTTNHPYISSSLRTTNISNIVKNSDTSFIVATYSSSIWRIDPTSTDDPVEIK